MTAAERILQAEIARDGAIPFARFMELALYAPGAGYYARPDRVIGRCGDFYTSVSVGPVFGFLLAARFAAWCRDFERVDLVEAGAHDGRLAADVLGALEQFHPEIWPRVRYWILEPQPARRAEQQPRLARWSGRWDWREDWPTGPDRFTGVIFANELLDAFPVRRFGWDARAGRWCEWGVEARPDGAGFGWRALPAACPWEAAVAAALEPVLPDGFIVEQCPVAEAWWTAASRALGRGWLVTADYGLADDEIIRPERIHGTARAYHGHRVSDDLLARPGDQDLTAHVDFGRLRAAGEAAGLRTLDLLPQGRWLGEIAVRILEAGGPAAEWLGRHARQLHTLSHPGHLGQAFRVLVQERPGSSPSP